MSVPKFQRKRFDSEPNIASDSTGYSSDSSLRNSSLRRNETQPLLGSQSGGRNVGPSPVIHENQDAITVRRPLQYYSIHPESSSGQRREHENRTQAAIHRYKYYSKLAPHGEESQLLMPNHVVPCEYFLIFPLKPQEKQSSVVTIFSIWNTMMGTSLLSIPWAIDQAGFAAGIGVMIVMATICFYTGYLILKSTEGLDPSQIVEFSDICKIYLGKWGEYSSFVFSIIAIIGALIVYWVLMSNFLYNTVVFIHDKIVPIANATSASLVNNSTLTDVYCPNPPWAIQSPSNEIIMGNITNYTSGGDVSVTALPPPTMFEQVWDQANTVPIFLIVILLPIVNFKSPTFFTKFNALGTLSVLYMMIFVVLKTSIWGVNMDFDTSHQVHVSLVKPTLPSLTGILLLAYFIHSCLISIMRNQKNPENNIRDLSISYTCVCFTYLFIGIVFYIGFPFPKECIEDNLLNNFRTSDVWAFVARVWLFFQILTVYPLLSYVARVQLMSQMFGSIYPSVKHVVILNILIITICVLVAIFYPHIGDIIRFSGAFCGLIYVFTLPCTVYMMSLKQKGKLTWPILIFHTFLIFLGVANLVSQFIIFF